MNKTTLLFGLLLAMLLTACSRQVDTVEPQVQNFRDGSYQVDTEKSMLYWEAFKPVGGHMGGISLKSGQLVVSGGLPAHGSFVVDMGSITNTDIEDESMRTMLVNDLLSDNFFSAADYPEARFEITKVSPYEGEGDYNFLVEGDLGLKGATAPIRVLAKITANEGVLTARGSAEVDRTVFGITIRSGSFFENLGDRLIKDIFVVEMELVAYLEQELP
ncbi:MAG: YceI family protein [Candidatus Peregrinibacteria bacterium]|nr:YceI family protein [Candidatus Peregrinibacteria bacterium]